MKSIDRQMNTFRLAARGVFNQYFRTDPKDKLEDAWTQIERFAEVERVLFDALVIQPCELEHRTYHDDTMEEIGVKLRHGTRAPAMVNRDIDSGYWDFPVCEVTTDTLMTFVHYCDWDRTDYIDFRYARVIIDSDASEARLNGKHALIETQYVKFFHRMPA